MCGRKVKYMDKRFFAITIALLLTLAIMISPVPGIADAGSFSGDTDFGGSWDSGSDWSSGSDWGSSWGDDDYYYGDYSGGSGGLSLPMPMLIVIVIIVLIVISRSKGKGSTTASRPVAGAQRTVLPMTIAELKEMDPAFSEEKMKEKIANLYIKMQQCWQEKAWDEMRAAMDDAIFNQFNMQLNSLIKSGRTNYMDSITVLGVELTGFGQDEKHDIITALIRTRLKDYTVDDATGNVVSGSKTAEKFMTYEWTLVRTKGAKSYERSENEAKNCPNCGAPLDLNASAKCEYCGAVIQSAEFDWVIKNIKGISQQTSGR